MSSVRRCRQSTLGIHSCDRCGEHAQAIHRPAGNSGGRYCAACWPTCKAGEAVKSPPTSVTSTRFQPAIEPPQRAAFRLAEILRAQRLSVHERVICGPAGLQTGLEIDGYFQPTWELTTSENIADVSAFNFAAIRERRARD